MGSERVQISAKIDANLIDWLDNQVDKKRFRTRSHALEFCIYALKEAESMKTQKVIA